MNGYALDMPTQSHPGGDHLTYPPRYGHHAGSARAQPFVICVPLQSYPRSCRGLSLEVRATSGWAVRMRGPAAVTAIVCSMCAARL